MVTGKIIRFDRTRGYGFIAPDNGGDDVFVHANDLDVDEMAVSVGARAEFEVVEGERGPKAYDVRLLDRVPLAGGVGAGNGAGSSRPANGVSPSSAPNGAAPAVDASDFDEECEVLSERAFSIDVTELLLTAAPTLTGAEVVSIRKALCDLARSHRWID